MLAIAAEACSLNKKAQRERARRIRTGILWGDLRLFSKERKDIRCRYSRN